MITTNGANILIAMILKDSVPANKVKDITGAVMTTSISITALNFTRKYVPGSSSGVMMHFGSGTTDASNDDYCLADDLGITPATVTAGKNGNKWYVNAILTNTGSSAITINEIGVTAGTQSNSKEYLIARKVVPTRTVAVGETATFTFTLDF